MHVLHKDRLSKYLKINNTTSSKKTSCICHYGPHHRPEGLINFMYPILLLTAHIFTIIYFLCCLILFIFIPLLLIRLLNVFYIHIFSAIMLLFHIHWECHKDIWKQNYMYTNCCVLKEILFILLSVKLLFILTVFFIFSSFRGNFMWTSILCAWDQIIFLLKAAFGLFQGHFTRLCCILVILEHQKLKRCKCILSFIFVINL